MSGLTLRGVLNDRVAGEASAADKTLALGAAGKKQTPEGHTQVLSFRDLEQSQHALAASGWHFSRGDHFRSQSKKPRPAGDQQEAEA